MIKSKILNNLSRFLSSCSRRNKYLRVLGIETSCDDTCAAIVDSDRNVLADKRFTQGPIHSFLGGILPPLATSMHRDNIKKVVQDCLEEAKLKFKDLDAVAVSTEPGIVQCLSVGLDYAKDICALAGKPLIPIHHMKAHALTIRVIEEVQFPFLVLLISGGNGILAQARSQTEFIILGETQDLSPGLALDRLARRLKLKNLEKHRFVAGGVALEKEAELGDPFSVHVNYKRNVPISCNLHFSGCHEAFLRYIHKEEIDKRITGAELLPNFRDICASYQYEITKQLCERVEIGIRYLSQKNWENKSEKTLVVSGGVASNQFIRKMLSYVCEAHEYKLLVPPKPLCTDNGVMVAWNGIENLNAGVPTVEKVNFDSVTVHIRSPIGESVASDVLLYRPKSKYVKLKSLILRERVKKGLPEVIDERSSISTC